MRVSARQPPKTPDTPREHHVRDVAHAVAFGFGQDASIRFQAGLRHFSQTGSDKGQIQRVSPVI